MDDSLISHLPEGMRTEAQGLRQERDSRRRQMLEQRHAFLERMMEEAQMRSSQSGGDASILPPTSWPQLSSQGMRYAVVNLNPHMLDGHVLGGFQSGAASYLSRGGGAGALVPHGKDQSSKQMLDQEALTCLLVLLFLDQTKLHNNRLHRIIKNLSQHAPTRAWILSSLLAIIKEMRRTPSLHATSSPSVSTYCPMPPPLTSSSRPAGAVGTTSSATDVSVVSSTPVIVTPHHYSIPHWLDISINAALGSHAKIFQLEGEVASKSAGTGNKINIHPLAGTTISHNVLDLLIFLGRHFGVSFLPAELLPKEKVEERKDESSDVLSNFWQILLKLDGAVGRKGKGPLKGFKYSENKELLTEQELFSRSIIGQLMDLFTHDIITDSVPLMDKLLRLLSIASSAIPRAGLRVTNKEATPTIDQPTPAQPLTSWSRQEQPESGGALEKSNTLDDVFKKEDFTTIKVSVVAPPLLSNIISVLTSGKCSEEGLEEATTLLTNLSKCSISTREQILFMLLDGVRTIGHTLCSQIICLDDSVNAKINEQALEKELLNYNQQDLAQAKKKHVPPGDSAAPSGGNILSGIVLPSAAGPEEQHVDHSHDLHLPTMEPLTCKGSQQSFFVRMLKVVCQLRESAQLAINAANKGTTATPTGAGSSSSNTGTAATDQQVDMEVNADSEQQATGPVQNQNEAQDGAGSNLKPSSGMEYKSVFLQTLSQQLELEELWSILSNCLDALSHTQDPHAVFVLQSTVEAFFLVHANYKDDGQKGRKKTSQVTAGSRFSRFSSSHMIDSESNPASPSPFSPLPGTPGIGEMEVDPFAHLPPDTAKFLKFAGMIMLYMIIACNDHSTVLNKVHHLGAHFSSLVTSISLIIRTPKVLLLFR